MQRVFCVRFSGDASYVYSGSDDMNVRVWKADASEQLGVTLSREKHKQAYNKALVNRCVCVFVCGALVLLCFSFLFKGCFCFCAALACGGGG